MTRMGKSEAIALVVTLVIPRLFLSHLVEIVDIGAGLGWLIYIISSVISLGIGLAVIIIQGKFNGDFLDTFKMLLGRKAFYLAGIFYAALFFSNAVLLLRQYAENTMLIGLSGFEINIIILVYAVLAGLVIYFGIEALARTACIVLPAAVLWMLSIYGLLIPVYNIYNLAPWQGTGVSTALFNSIPIAGANIGALAIAILAPLFQNSATRINSVFWGCVGAGFLKTISCIVFLLVVGAEVGSEKMLPFFEMASRVYLHRSFQRLEDFTVLLWVNIGALSIGFSIYIFLYLTARMLNLTTIRPLIPVSCVLAYLLANIQGDISAVIRTDLAATQFFYAFGLYIIPGILLAAFWIKKHKRGYFHD